MKEYLRIVNEILENGIWKENRTGVRALTCPNLIFSHNMEDGYPLLTTKKMAVKAMAVELEGFIKGITDKRWFQERQSHIWDQWCSPLQIPDEINPYFIDENNKEYYRKIQGQELLNWQKDNPDLGPLGYSWGWRSFGAKYKPIPHIYTGLDKSIKVEESDDELVGQEIDGKYGKYIVINKYYKDNKSKYTVKFINTGYIKNNLDKRTILNKNIFDIYNPTVCGVACWGNYKRFKNQHIGKYLLDDNIIKKLLHTWRGMIRRCYDINNRQYHTYGKIGIYVENRWLIFENFLQDVIYIDGWNNKFNNWDDYALDKDISGEGFYGRNTCKWVSAIDNANHTTKTYYFDATAPDGTIYKNCLGARRFCRKFNLCKRTVISHINNGIQTPDGWKFKRLSSYKRSIQKGFDQLADIVEKLKTNPDDRRMVCSAWNPLQNDQVALPACHLLWTLTHINGTLHMSWIQRSVDTMLGLPFNIASYALLLTLLCQYGFRPGTLTGLLCDCHIYENHIKGAYTQLDRIPHLLPRLEIDNTNFDIFNWTHENMKLIDYNHEPAIKFPIAI